MGTRESQAVPRAGTRYRGRLLAVFCLVLGFMVVEVVAAFATGSLSLLSDAGHMAADAVGIGIALAAIIAADSAERRGHRTFGVYRLEILAALANAVLLFLVSAYVLIEAVRRFGGETPEVLSGPMLVVAVAGLLVNIAGWRLLREGAKESLNVEGALVEVVADLLGSVAVVIAAVIIQLTGWYLVDVIFGVAIGLFILPRALRLGRRALRILVEAAPEHIDLERLERQLTEIDSVIDVHDLHVWTLTSEMDVASVHLMTRDGADPHPVLDQARAVLRDEYAIDHATLQVEPESHHGCTEITW